MEELEAIDPGRDGPVFVPRLDEPAAGAAPAAWPEDPALQLPAVLRLHHVPERLGRALLEALPAGEPPLQALAAAIGASFAFAPWPLLLPRGPVVLVGPPGAGKTTLAAKMAARLRRSRARLASTDLERPGRIAQLGEYAAALGFPLATAPAGAPLPAAIAGHAAETLILDTPGTSSRDPDGLARVAALVEASAGTAVLVLPASADPEEAMAEADRFRDVGARHLVVTRADLARRWGGVLAAAAAGGLALAGASFAPHFAYGLRPLTPRILARRLLSAALDERRWRV
jgi:flagellar biosynthesis protein FlhF